MNKIFRTLWNPARGTWVAAPETSRGHARSTSSAELGAPAVAVLLLGTGQAIAAGGAGGQPVGNTSLNGGSGGSTGSGGDGRVNDSAV